MGMNKVTRSNRFWEQINVFIVILLSIFLTTAVPEVASSQQLCQTLFSASKNQFTASELPLGQIQTSAHKKWQNIFSRIDTFSKFVNVMNKVVSAEKNLKTEDFIALQNVDLISVSKNMSHEDLQQLRNFIKKISQERSLSDNPSQFGHWIYALSFYFYPEKFTDFIGHLKIMSEGQINLQEAFSGHLGLWTMNKTFIRTISELPQQFREKILADLRKKISSISLDSELMSMQPDGLSVPNSRRYRRNLEVVVFLLLRPQITRLASELALTQSEQEIQNALGKYYAEVDKIYLPQRGGYSPQIVLKTAKVIQSYLGKYLHQETDYIDLYGSFPNGKATFKTSDVDIKLSDTLLLKLTNKNMTNIKQEPFSLYFSDMVARNKNQLSGEFFKFWESYQSAELQLAKEIFHRLPVQSSELLTTLYPPQPYSNDILDFRWYNPIVIRIYKDRIAIQILDLADVNPKSIEIGLR
jgi:hypothetical protein